jgi:ribonucleoside-diphosphate reductase alpha chain
MAHDMLYSYSVGWKTSYYQNTYDNKTDEVKEELTQDIQSLIEELSTADESSCDSCSI